VKTLSLPLLLTALIGLTACDQPPQDTKVGDGHGMATEAAAEDAHGHGPEGEKLTHFTERTELFVEFPKLVVGEKAAFAAHVSRLPDFRALTAGKLSVRLSGNGQPDEVFAVDGPAQPGIFRPEAQPKHAGERELTIEIRLPEYTVVHELGPVAVYADRKAADAVHSPHEEAGIAFTKEQQWKVDFATVEAVMRPVRSTVAANGVLRARPDGEALIAAPAAGLVRPAGAFPSLGQTVRKGQVLAYLVPRLGGDRDLASLESEVRKARAELDFAAQELARMEGLYRDEAVPEKRVQSARAAEAQAQAEYDAARQRLDQQGGAGGGVPIRAPVAGTMADVRVTGGAYVEEGAPLFHLADRSRLWLEMRVPESEAARLVNPRGAAFKVSGDPQSFEIVPGKNGRLVAVGGVVDATTRTLPVVFEFVAPKLALPIGLAVQAQVYLGGARETLAIPASAVLDEGGLSVVFVQIGGESFERRQVRLGAREGDWVEVLDGLTAGSRVVSKGAYLVKLASTGTAQIGHGHAH
jgi:cobalt-zinc-cadmium efflux system membrane fusion protein